MKNKELIAEFIRGEKKHGAANHCMYSGGEFVNYDTTLCTIDRDTKRAKLNSRKYSRSTSTIQRQLHDQLSVAGYEIEEYEGEPRKYWGCGQVGAAPTLTTADAKEWGGGGQ